jgi:hypothetical protein
MPLDTPSIIRGYESDYKKLFHRGAESALRVEVTIPAGYGVLEAGIVLAKNVSAAGNVSKYVPYCIATPAPGDTNLAKAGAFLVQDGSSTTLYVTMEDSYKFIIGDDVIILDDTTNTTTAVNLGAITGIDRTTHAHMAIITVTSSVSGSFTVANGAIIHVECGADNVNGWSDAAGILEKSVDCGVGVDAKGALASMILPNAGCVLYAGMLINADAVAKTDLGATALHGNLLQI